MAEVLNFRSFSQIESLRLREIVRNEQGVLTSWFNRDKAARARFRIRVNHLKRTPRLDWNRKQFHKLDGGLAEIKWESGNKQYRVIGFDYQGAFVMLLGCTHKQNIYDPASSLATAKRLKGEVENGSWNTRVFEP